MIDYQSDLTAAETTNGMRVRVMLKLADLLVLRCHKAHRLSLRPKNLVRDW